MNGKLYLITIILVSFTIYLTVYFNFQNFPLFPLNGITRSSVDTPSIGTNITKIIHQSWKTKTIPPFFDHYVRSWVNHCFTDWKYILWTDEDNLKLIQNHYPWFVNKYHDLPANIYRVDVSRYFYLFHFGGIYTDLDNECIKPFDHLLANYSLVFGAMKGQFGGTSLKEGYVQNSFMYSRPKHPFWMELIVNVLQSTTRAIPEVQTGPVLLSNKIRDFTTRHKTNDELIVYPPEYFNPFSWLHNDNINCKTYNKMSPTEYEKCKSFMIAKGSFVIQYHAHNW